MSVRPKHLTQIGNHDKMDSSRSGRHKRMKRRYYLPYLCRATVNSDKHTDQIRANFSHVIGYSCANFGLQFC